MVTASRVGRAIGVRAAAAASVLFCTVTGLADDRQIPRVRVQGCDGLEVAELEEFIELETSVLGELPPDVQSYELIVTCEASDVELSFRDASGNERLRRGVRLADARQLSSREIALAAAELLLAWNWLPTARPSPGPTQTPASEGGAPPPPSSEPTGEVTEPLKFSGGISGVSTFRSLGQGPLLSLGVEGHGGWRSATGWGASVFGSWTFGQAGRASGQVNAESGTFGLGIGYLSPSESVAHVLASLALGASFVSLVGKPNEDDLESRRVRGWLPEASLAVGPAFDAGPAVLSLRGVVGWSFSALEARVVDDSPVKYGGPIVGLRFDFVPPLDD